MKNVKTLREADRGVRNQALKAAVSFPMTITIKGVRQTERNPASRISST
jgi:hypothetical protein